MPYFLFDIGASQTKIGASFDGENFENTQIYPTPQNFEEGVKVLTEKAKQLGDKKFTAAIGGIAGPLDRKRTMITAAPNLPDWNGKPLSDAFTQATGIKIHLENDTALAGLGEATEGPGKPFSIVAYMTVSTGVNGVLILDKSVAPNARGFEIGKHIIDFDKTYDQESVIFENFVAGSQFPRRFGAPAHEIADPNIWSEEANLVSIGLTNLILFWSPEIVILGGSVAKSIPLDALIEKTRERLTVFPELPLIKKAELGDFAGLWGALHWAKSL